MLIIAIAEYRYSEPKEHFPHNYRIEKHAYLLTSWEQDTELRNKLRKLDNFASMLSTKVEHLQGMK